MSIPARCMEIARSKLGADVFEEIYGRAIHLERKAIEAAPALPASERVHKPLVAARLEAHLNDLPPPPKVSAPHVKARLEERFAIKVGPNDLGELEKIVRDGDRNTKTIKREMICIAHLEVSWRGKHFIVLFDQSKQRLVTAYPKAKKRKSKRPASDQRGAHGLNAFPNDADHEDDE